MDLDIVPAENGEVVPGTGAEFFGAFKIVHRCGCLRETPRVCAQASGEVGHPVSAAHEPLLVEGGGLRTALLQGKGLRVEQPGLGVPQRQLVPCGLSAPYASDSQLHVNLRPAVPVQHQLRRTVCLMRNDKFCEFLVCHVAKLSRRGELFVDLFWKFCKLQR